MICFLKKVKKNREESWFSHVVPNTPATRSRWTPQLSLHAWATQILVKFEQSKEKKKSLMQGKSLWAYLPWRPHHCYSIGRDNLAI